MTAKNVKKYDIDLIISLCDGKRKSADIAKIVECPQKYVQAQMKKYNLPRLPRGAMRGQSNPSYKHGRVYDRDGYVSVPAPSGHPFAKLLQKRNFGRILEHRLVMEMKLGRYLNQSEVVDHIDGLHVHNDIKNLRLFSSNAEHLTETISGIPKSFSRSGVMAIRTGKNPNINLPRVDIHRDRKRRGDVRLQQILLAMLKLGKDSPYLLGSHSYLEKAGIDYYSDYGLKQGLDDLNRRFEQDLLT